MTGTSGAEGAEPRRFGVLVISHGSRDPEWVRLIDDAVEEMEVPAGVPVVSSFLELVEGRLIQDGIDRLERGGVTDLVAIPLFVSSGSTHWADIRRALGLVSPAGAGKSMADGTAFDAGGGGLGARVDPPDPALPPFRLSARVHGGEPLDDCAEMVEMLSGYAFSLSDAPEQEMVLLIGHGSKQPGFHRLWRQMLRSLSRQVQERCGFAAADYAMLLPDQIGCRRKVWERKYGQLRKIVLPLFLSEGYFTKQVIPSRLQGFSHVYDGRALLPNPLVSRWLTRQAALFLQRK